MRDSLAIFSFKDYRFVADYRDDDDLSVSMFMDGVPDTYDPSHMIDLSMTFLVPWRDVNAYANMHVLAHFLFEAVKEFVCHEAGEFVLVDGERRFNPHVLFGDAAYDSRAAWQRALGIRPTIGPDPIVARFNTIKDLP